MMQIKSMNVNYLTFGKYGTQPRPIVWFQKLNRANQECEVVNGKEERINQKA